MPFIGKTIEGFRSATISSVRGFYDRRGLQGRKLADFAQGLRTQAVSMRELGEPKDRIKASLASAQADLLRFPQNFSTTPTRDSSFLVVDHGGLTEVQASLSQSQKSKYVHGLLASAYDDLLSGLIGGEGHYAGLGTRIELKKPKFLVTPTDLLQGLKVFAGRIGQEGFDDDEVYLALERQIAEHGGLESIANSGRRMHQWNIGERIFLAKLFETYRISRDVFGMSEADFTMVVKKLKFKIVVNAESGGPIVENFVKNKMFGLDPKNVIFIKQAQHPTMKVEEDGGLLPSESNRSQGNHGLIGFQSILDGQWFRLIPQDSESGYRDEYLSYDEYREFQASIQTLLIESVEDTSQYLKPYDHVYTALIKKHGAEIGTRFFMQMVRNKADNPQKGGFLAGIQPEGLAGRNGVLESNRAPEIKPKDINILNRNRNGIYDPNGTDDVIMAGSMIDDLHPTFEPQSDGSIEIDPKIPQGDRNLYLPSLYLMFDPTPPIENLKDPADIIPTLNNMRRMESDPALGAFAKDFLHLEG